MPEANEPAAVSPAHDSTECPFCPLQKDKRELKSFIGKDNNSKTLAGNLEATGDEKQAHLYYDAEYELYRRYSAEAHHLICGNEVMKEEAEVERFLIEDSKSASKGAAGLLKPNDVGYDINGARNGIWLPSVPDMFRRKDGEPKRWWGDQTTWNRKHPRKPKRVSLDEWEKCDAAFIVMDAVKRQFHKGEHGSVGEPHNNYVVMAINRLRQVSVLLGDFSETCPMEDNGEPRKQPPYWPPYGVVAQLDGLSRSLREELTGPPETWNYFISNYALECSAWWKRHLAG